MTLSKGEETPPASAGNLLNILTASSRGGRSTTATNSVRGRQSLKESTSRASVHRSAPPVHELTTHCIQYKPEDTMERFRNTATAPTNMTHLPCVKEKLVSSRKLLLKVVGFDANTFEGNSNNKSSGQSNKPSPNLKWIAEIDNESSKYNNAFSPRTSQRTSRATRESELSRKEFLRGRGLPATPRLLRGDVKNYGIRRQISSTNQLELSHDRFNPTDSVHYNTPAEAGPNSETAASSPGKPEVDSPTAVKTSEARSPHVDVTPFGEVGELSNAFYNRLLVRDRQRDAPWVYCYKIRRDRINYTNLLAS